MVSGNRSVPLSLSMLTKQVRKLLPEANSLLPRVLYRSRINWWTHHAYALPRRSPGGERNGDTFVPFIGSSLQRKSGAFFTRKEGGKNLTFCTQLHLHLNLYLRAFIIGVSLIRYNDPLLLCCKFSSLARLVQT